MRHPTGVVSHTNRLTSTVTKTLRVALRDGESEGDS